MRTLELLAPAADKVVAIQAILHGADAVYMGASSHGARKNASNSLDDIREVVAFAHQFRAKVYVTVNTLVYDSEVGSVEKLVSDLYRVGVDAIIVQDFGLLRMNLPPIELHASTQCDTRTVEKSKFLEAVGFSQIVLARELSLEEISEICGSVSVPVECFVHGALCVSYSGRCRASQVQTGRSANRGECAQMCRLPYTLLDSENKVILKDKYLLSLRDLNSTDTLEALVSAGVSSFKIEGRLKDVSYVKNITAYYRMLLDRIIAKYPEDYCRSSYGSSEITFTPDPDKSFNRGFTSYFQRGRRNESMASLATPKSLGEKITDISQLNNGDGISFCNSKGEYEGVRVNRIENGRIIGARPFRLPPNCEIRRTFNREWQSELEKPTAVRKLDIDIEIDPQGLTASDERGIKVRVPLGVALEQAKKPMNPENILGKLGNTIYRLRHFTNNLPADAFIPASRLSDIKRRMIEALDTANQSTYPLRLRRKEDVGVRYPVAELMSDENVANGFAERFFSDHGSIILERAIEVERKESQDASSGRHRRKDEILVMTTRYCLRRELGACKKNMTENGKSILSGRKEPYSIISGSNRFRLEFDCSRCEMRVFKPLGK